MVTTNRKGSTINDSAAHAHDDELMQDLSKPMTPLEYGRLFFSGFAMGASDIVPGVSGGTMAFILGIYETLLNAIKSFNMQAVRLFFGLFQSADAGAAGDSDNGNRFMDLVDHLHLRFLLALGFGLLSAVLLLSSLLEGLLVTQPTYIFAFFAGLIIASIVAIGLKVRWSAAALAALVVGGLIAFLITDPSIDNLGEAFGHGLPVLFISGAIAICAMILPGISGSFILLLLGQYDFVLGAVRERDIASLIAVAAGAGIGILVFSRVLSWLLDRYENTTIALLVGFMAGSLRLIAFRATNYIDEETKIATAIDMTGERIAIAIGIALVGFLLVSFIDHLQTRNNPIFRIFGGSTVDEVIVTEK